MPFLFAVLIHTPPWVYAILAYLIVMGVRGMRPRTLSLVRVFITPAIFIAWGLFGLAGGRGAPTLAFPAWLCGAALGAIPGVLTSPRQVALDRVKGLVHFEGSIFPLLRNLVIFLARYGLAVAAATGGANAPTLVLIAAGVSGLSAGFFLGWTGMFLRTLNRKPSQALAAS